MHWLFPEAFPQTKVMHLSKECKTLWLGSNLFKKMEKHAKVIHFQSKGFLPSKTGNRCNSFPFRRCFLQQCNQPIIQLFSCSYLKTEKSVWLFSFAAEVALLLFFFISTESSITWGEVWGSLAGKQYTTWVVGAIKTPSRLGLWLILIDFCCVPCRSTNFTTIFLVEL